MRQPLEVVGTLQVVVYARAKTALWDFLLLDIVVTCQGGISIVRKSMLRC